MKKLLKEQLVLPTSISLKNLDVSKVSSIKIDTQLLKDVDETCVNSLGGSKATVSDKSSGNKIFLTFEQGESPTEVNNLKTALVGKGYKVNSTSSEFSVEKGSQTNQNTNQTNQSNYQSGTAETDADKVFNAAFTPAVNNIVNYAKPVTEDIIRIKKIMKL